jgi:hypothetical protein
MSPDIVKAPIINEMNRALNHLGYPFIIDLYPKTTSPPKEAMIEFLS